MPRHTAIVATSHERAAEQASYDHDVFSWANEQAQLIREGRFDALDRENVAEEIESVGRSERSSLTSYLARIMQHMLKWDHQPDLRSSSWAISIRIHRVHAERTLRQNPGLKGRMAEILDDAYRIACLYAAEEMGVAEDMLPRARPYSSEQVMGQSGVYDWPESAI